MSRCQSRGHSWEMAPNEYDNVYHVYVHRVLWPVFHNRPDLARYQKAGVITYKTCTRTVACTLYGIFAAQRLY